MFEQMVLPLRYDDRDFNVSTEGVTKNHQNSLCDSLVNISSEDAAIRVTRSNE